MALDSFVRLPAEVRNSIYSWLFHGALIEDHGLSPCPIRTRNYHLPITMTSKQIRLESLSILNAVTTLHFRVGQAQFPPLPMRVVSSIETIRIPAHRLRTLDTASFKGLQTLMLDVSIEPAMWKLFQRKRPDSRHSPADVSDLIDLGMTLGIFESSWDVRAVLADPNRSFKMVCWVSAWEREQKMNQAPVLVDLDRGVVLNEAGDLTRF